MLFPIEYPYAPPKCKFLTKIKHPNIMEDGTISVDILETKWSVVLEGRTIILSLISLLCDPEYHNASTNNYSFARFKKEIESEKI